MPYLQKRHVLLIFASLINLTEILDTDPLPIEPPLCGGLPISLNLLILLSHFIDFHAPEGLGWAGWITIVIIAFCCLILSAFVSGSEIAYFGLNQRQIEEIGENESMGAKRSLTLLNNSERLLATILISNNLVNITMVVLLTFAIQCTVNFVSPLADFLLQTVFLTFLLLLFGEIFPKLVAKGRKMQWVLHSSGGIMFLFNLFAPLAKLMVRSTSIVNRIIKTKHEEISTEELSQALEISDVEADKDKEMLEGILSFGDKQVSDIMTARVDVTDIEYHARWSEVMDVILKSGFSRIPVYDTSQDAIRGVLYAKDLLPYIRLKDDDFQWQSILRKAYFVPESRMIDDLLEDFRKRKIHIAIVVDEYGATCGIVTLEDVIEEIVGDIDDEYDTEDKMYRRLADGSLLFNAKISLTDFCRVLDIDPDTLKEYDEAETLAGLLLDIKGDFPKERERFHLPGLELTVLKIERHRILSVKVRIIPEETNG